MDPAAPSDRIQRPDPAPGSEGPRPDPRSLGRLRWLVPIAAALLVFVVIAGIEATRQSNRMSAMTTIQTTGFYKPTTGHPVSFSLPVLQAGSPAQAGDVRSVTMASLRGEPVVLNMWASYCSICKEETPAIEAVARRAGHAVRFVGIDTADQRSTALAFLHRYGVTYLQLFDSSARVGSGYEVPGLPVTVFVSAKGKVMGEYLGALGPKSLGHYLGTLFGVRLPTG